MYVYVCMYVFSNIFSSETIRPIEANFYVEGEPIEEILVIGTTRAEQNPLLFSLRTTYRDLGGHAWMAALCVKIALLITLHSNKRK